MPSRQEDQQQLRQRRRAHLPHTYGEHFSLATEIEQVCGPLAAGVAARPNPRHYGGLVEELAGAVHTACCRLSKMITRAQKVPQVRHITDKSTRDREFNRLLSEVPLPRPPQITDAAVTSGQWATMLIEHARPIAADLQKMLALTPPARCARTPSELLEEALRLVDDAAANLARALKTAQSAPKISAPRPPVTADEIWEALVDGKPVAFTLDFDLHARFKAILRPLGSRVAACDDPEGLLAGFVDELVDDVHEACSEISVLIAEFEGHRKVAGVGYEQRHRAYSALMDLHQRPVRPDVINADGVLNHRQWVWMLCELARPLGSKLSRLLDWAPPPPEGRMGGDSASERLASSLLRVHRAAIMLEKRIDVLARRATQPAVPTPTREDKARAELARLGVPL